MHVYLQVFPILVNLVEPEYILMLYQLHDCNLPLNLELTEFNYFFSI